MTTQVKKKTVSLRQVINAIKKNGFQQSKVTLLKYQGNPIDSRRSTLRYGEGPVPFESACAVGQAAVNLGVDASDLEYALSSTHLKNGRNLYSAITHMNDIEGISCQEIAERFEQSGGIVDYSTKYLLTKRQYIYKPSTVEPEIETTDV